ncbi:hypothetical protein SAMN05216267_1017135 [Actinacidiphila rubida]|uniref:Uncharacterized protein n=1 Tax=Actinacidiphila rubida TaxID=310780 RepID=A0A1H8M145_9ACTN|nr:hypothetical protein [Actinacidiphila rubida]SEO11093.1 hypothetical protein SAMN05216267_1017135 [Actinacidiphila rubida]
MSESTPVWARDLVAAQGTPDAPPQEAPGGERPEDAPAATGTTAEPQPLGVTVAATGNAEVDAAVERLGDADELPVHAHIEVYEDVHQGLRDTLTALDENRG